MFAKLGECGRRKSTYMPSETLNRLSRSASIVVSRVTLVTQGLKATREMVPVNEVKSTLYYLGSVP